MNETGFLFDEPSSPKTETEKEWIGPRHLTASQAAALSRLCDLAGLRGQPDRGGVALRNKPLLVGPSGSGKTALVRRLCDVENLPLLVVNAGSWIVHGASSGPHTLMVIQRFLEANAEGCLLIDEIDKCTPGTAGAFKSTWALGVFCEILAVSDSDNKLLTSGWRPENIRRLSQSYLVVGAGAWQAHVAANEDGGVSEDNGYVSRIIKDAGIPDEILLRFHPQILALTRPTAKDLALAVRRIRAELSLPALAPEEEMRLGQEAARSRYGMRWAEAYLSELLIKFPQLRKKKPVPTAAINETVSLTRNDFNQKLNGLIEQLDAMRKPAKELEVKLNLARMIATQSTVEQRKNFLEPGEISTFVQEICGLSSGLSFGLSATEKERLKRETQAQVHGGQVLRLLNSWLQDKAFSLKSCGALEASIELQVQLQRVLDTWKYLGKVQVMG